LAEFVIPTGLVAATALNFAAAIYGEEKKRNSDRTSPPPAAMSRDGAKTGGREADEGAERVKAAYGPEVISTDGGPEEQI
jgi:hypothetical protein